MNSRETDFREAAFGLLKRLEDKLPTHYKLYYDNKENIVIAALTQHREHLYYQVIDQKTLDLAKLSCWITGAILSQIDQTDVESKKHQCEIVIVAVLDLLNEILMLETDERLHFDNDTEILLSRMLTQEYSGRPNHGIGMNGLFVAYHCYLQGFKVLA